MVRNQNICMPDKSDDSDSKKKGFFIHAKGVSCIPCRFKRQSYHKETKTIKDNNIVTTNTVIDKRNIKFGSTGRHVSPDENNIFKNDGQIGSVEICSTGWGTANKITPEECGQRIEENTTDIEVIKKDIERIEIELDGLKQRILKKLNKYILRMYNARLSAIIDELEDCQHLSQYKKRFKFLFEFYQLHEILK